MIDYESYLNRWLSAGVLDAVTASRIRSWESAQKPAALPPAPEPKSTARESGLAWQGRVALILGGILASFIVPVFVEHLTTRDEDDAWDAISVVFTTAVLLSWFLWRWPRAYVGVLSVIAVAAIRARKRARLLAIASLKRRRRAKLALLLAVRARKRSRLLALAALKARKRARLLAVAAVRSRRRLRMLKRATAGAELRQSA